MPFESRKAPSETSASVDRAQLDWAPIKDDAPRATAVAGGRSSSAWPAWYRPSATHRPLNRLRKGPVIFVLLWLHPRACFRLSLYTRLDPLRTQPVSDIDRRPYLPLLWAACSRSQAPPLHTARPLCTRSQIELFPARVCARSYYTASFRPPAYFHFYARAVCKRLQRYISGQCRVHNRLVPSRSSRSGWRAASWALSSTTSSTRTPPPRSHVALSPHTGQVT